MKKLVNLLFLFLSFTFVFSGCSDDYDDTFIKSEIAGIRNEIAALKQQVTSVEALFTASQEGKVITDLVELENGKGYKITFADDTVIEVLRGGNASAVTVKEHEGVYYWSLITNGNADFILDAEGNKLPIVAKGEDASKLEIDPEGYWTVNRKRIKDANNDWVRFSKGSGDSFFTDIEDTDDEVIFTLEDGATLTIARGEKKDDDKKEEGSFMRLDLENPDDVVVFKARRAKKIDILFSEDMKMEVTKAPEGWRTNIHRPNRYLQITPPNVAEFGVKEVHLQGIDKNGLVYLAKIRVSMEGITFNDPNGIFVLNEGNMTTETGSLIYISPKGVVMENVYQTVNGKNLGNVTQDLFIHDGKMYIIAQNGNTSSTGLEFQNEGFLTVADLKTMKRVAGYNDELKSLSWSSHIAVLDDSNIFIRDNHGVHLFDSATGKLTKIEGSDGAKKLTMAVAAGKVFAAAGSNVLVFEKGKTSVSKTISMGANVTGVVKSHDNNLWIATVGTPQKITKLDASTLEVIKVNEVKEGSMSTGPAASSGITAVGDLIYYSGMTTKIHVHNFATGESKLIDDVKPQIKDPGMLYNTIGVHPKTGHVFMNTIKAFGWDFLVNSISEFEVSTGKAIKKNEFKDHTHFPAGFFFTANFN